MYMYMNMYNDMNMYNVVHVLHRLQVAHLSTLYCTISDVVRGTCTCTCTCSTLVCFLYKGIRETSYYMYTSACALPYHTLYITTILYMYTLDAGDCSVYR